MKILIINYRYFVSGGPERYMFNLEQLLKSKGHEVIPFSIKYLRNVKTEYDKYFVTPISSEDEVYFKEHSFSIKSTIKAIERSFYSKEVYKKLSELIREEKPDFAIVLHYLKKLSPAVLKCLNDNKIPFFVRLSDFLMVCPNAHLFRDNDVCELCIKGSLLNSIRYRCVQNSMKASVVHYIATKYHRFKKYFDNIPYFIVPSLFTINKMVEAGWEERKFVHIPTFVEESYRKVEKENIISYVGRIEKTKGVHILLEALALIKNEIKDVEVVITGNGDKNYIDELVKIKEKYDLKNVNFTGNLERDRITDLLNKSLFTITPAIWYENMPNSVLESFASGTTVIASNLGSLKELISEGQTGLLFKSGDSYDLSLKIKHLLNNRKQCIKMGEEAFNYVKINHSSEKHYKKLEEVINRSH